MTLDDDPLLHRADAFMSRLRPPAEDDVPVLTEVVELDSTHADTLPPPAAVATLALPGIDPQALEAAIHAAVARALDNWLDLTLPDVVLRVLDGLADQMILQVSDQARKDLLPWLQASLSQAYADHLNAPVAGSNDTP